MLKLDLRFLKPSSGLERMERVVSPEMHTVGPPPKPPRTHVVMTAPANSRQPPKLREKPRLPSRPAPVIIAAHRTSNPVPREKPQLPSRPAAVISALPTQHTVQMPREKPQLPSRPVPVKKAIPNSQCPVEQPVAGLARSLTSSLVSVSGTALYEFHDYRRSGDGETRAMELSALVSRRFSRVLMVGPLRKQNRGGFRTYMFVLTDEVLAYFHGPNRSLELNRELPLETIVIENGPLLAVRSPAKSFVVEAETPGESATWRRALHDAAAARRANLGISHQPTELAPIWTPNAQADACTKCGATFTLLRRRHHCRACGALVCHACSAERAPIALTGPSTLHRVCNPCHAKYADSRTYGVDRFRQVDALPATTSQNRPPPLPPRWNHAVRPSS